MADINEIITLGLGAPSDIPHFVLLGLSVVQVAPDASADWIVQAWADDVTVLVPKEEVLQL